MSDDILNRAAFPRGGIPGMTMLEYTRIQFAAAAYANGAVRSPHDIAKEADWDARAVLAAFSVMDKAHD